MSNATKNSESISLSSLMIESVGGPWAWFHTGGIWFGAEICTIFEANTWPSAIGSHRFWVHTIARDSDVALRVNKAVPLLPGAMSSSVCDALVEWMRWCDAVVDAADTATNDDDEPNVTLEAVRRAMTRVWQTLPTDAEAVMNLDLTDVLETREAIDVGLERLSIGDLDRILATVREMHGNASSSPADMADPPATW